MPDPDDFDNAAQPQSEHADFTPERFASIGTIIFTAPQHAGQAMVWAQAVCERLGGEDAAEQRFGNVAVFGVRNSEQVSDIIGCYHEHGGRDLRFIFCLGKTRNAFEMGSDDSGQFGDVMIAGFKPTRVIGLPGATSRTWIMPSSYDNLMPLLDAPFEQGPKACMLPTHALN